MANQIDLLEVLRNVEQDALGLEELDEKLKQLPQRDLTKEEIRAQKVSFIMAMLPHGSTITRKQVAASIEQNPYR